MHGCVDPRAVIRTIPDYNGHRLGDLIEQGADLRGIIDAAVGQRGGNNPAAARVHADVHRVPGAPLLGTMLLDQPFARPTQLQRGAEGSVTVRARRAMVK